jgi:hypothetical protein
MADQKVTAGTAAPSRIVAAHDQVFSHTYLVHYPSHDPRANDPHKHDFDEWKRRRKASDTYYCDFAHDHRNGDTSECTTGRPLEAHHNLVELAMLNEVDLTLLEHDFPGISKQEIGEWIDQDHNLTLLCINHHRSPMGVHTASYSDFRGEFYVRNLIGAAPKH